MMTNVILSRLELLSDQHESAILHAAEAHSIAVAAENARHATATEAEFFRMIASLDLELDNMVYNMSQRCKARGVREKTDRYAWLHGLAFDQTYLDLYNADQKDYRVREYFEPLLRACGGDKKLLMARYKLALDRYFPVPFDDRVWGPVLRRVPFKPRRKTDKRTTTYTIIHNYSHTKKVE